MRTSLVSRTGVGPDPVLNKYKSFSCHESGEGLLAENSPSQIPEASQSVLSGC